MDPILEEWGSFLLRWVHVVTAIAWIGASFYFMHLDASLRPTPACRPARAARPGRCMAAASTRCRNTWWRRRTCRST